MTPTVAFIVGARPNFIKIAPVLRAVRELATTFQPVLVHTGQHYSPELADVFFEQLGIPRPDVHLNVGSASHGAQTGRILEAFEAYLLECPEKPDAVVVIGDVNSTVAAALAASKLMIPVVHLEAGLRSFDRTMPEEINRLATDAISDLLLVSEPAGEENLRREGVSPDRIRYVGNVMIDTLVHHLSATGSRPSLVPYSDFALVTVHRPSNVDSREQLSPLVSFLVDASQQIPVAFPVHPRTRQRLAEFGLLPSIENQQRITLLPPLGYLENLSLMRKARLVLTDSGGIQEETSFLGVPCLTLRSNTERPVTTTLGTNTLVGSDFTEALRLIRQILAGAYRPSQPIPGWDGHASRRVVQALAAFVGKEVCVSASV